MKLTWLGSAFLCTTLLYCGGGRGGGGSSGLDSNKTIGELDAAEAEILCEFLSTSLPAQRTITCDGQEITIGLDPAEIEARIAECAAEVAGLDSCTATVGDAEDCANAQAGLFDGLSDDELCELLMNPPPTPASCQALDDDPACSEDDEPPPPQG